MPKFTVTVEITDYFEVDLEAESKEEAKSAATELMAMQDDPLKSKYYEYSSGFEATSCTKIQDG